MKVNFVSPMPHAFRLAMALANKGAKMYVLIMLDMLSLRNKAIEKGIIFREIFKGFDWGKLVFH
jgi:hypothetical protein